MVTKHNQNVGCWGEGIACQYLRDLDWQILERNYVLRLPGVCQSVGEIDIIAKNDGVIVFVEVKTRRDSRFGTSLEAITFAKEKKLRMLAELYLLRFYPNSPCRFDVIGIDCIDGQVKLTHVRNAF